MEEEDSRLIHQRRSCSVDAVDDARLAVRRPALRS